MDRIALLILTIVASDSDNLAVLLHFTSRDLYPLIFSLNQLILAQIYTIKASSNMASISPNTRTESSNSCFELTVYIKNCNHESWDNPNLNQETKFETVYKCLKKGFWL